MGCLLAAAAGDWKGRSYNEDHHQEHGGLEHAGLVQRSLFYLILKPRYCRSAPDARCLAFVHQCRGGSGKAVEAKSCQPVETFPASRTSSDRVQSLDSMPKAVRCNCMLGHGTHITFRCRICLQPDRSQAARGASRKHPS